LGDGEGTRRSLASVSAEVLPPELAQLIDVAERPRVGNWSLRAALTRYGQPQPQRTSDFIEVLRRIEVAVHSTSAEFEQHGPDLWAALNDGADAAELAPVVELLRIIRDVDTVGEALARWANDKSQERPDGDIDRVTPDAMRRLDALGVPREEGRPPTRGRG
jgi:hypothetical protein